MRILFMMSAFFLISTVGSSWGATEVPIASGNSSFVRFINTYPEQREYQPIINDNSYDAVDYGIGNYFEVPPGKTLIKFGSLQGEKNLISGKSYTVFSGYKAIDLSIVEDHDFYAVHKPRKPRISTDMSGVTITSELDIYNNDPTPKAFVLLYNFGGIENYQIKSSDGKEIYGTRGNYCSLASCLSTGAARFIPTDLPLALYVGDKKLADFPAVPLKAGKIYSILIDANEENPVVFLSETEKH